MNTLRRIHSWRFGLALCVALGLWLLTQPLVAWACGGNIICVDADAAGMVTGLSWTDAFTNVQDALAMAWPGSEIWVAEGVYYPDEGWGQINDDRTATFTLRDGVAIYGGFVGNEAQREQRDWVAHPTILSGDIDGNDVNSDGNYIAETWADIQGDNAYHVVTGLGELETARLDGFIITAGNADSEYPNNEGYGGGMFNSYVSGLDLANLIFSGNYATTGGGMLNEQSSLTLVNSTFRGNQSGLLGGGLHNYYGSVVLTDVTFLDNHSQWSGGGMFNEYSDSILTGVTFSDNLAVERGGGLYNYESSPLLTDVIFSGNQAIQGGGMFNELSFAELTNVVFSGNYASYSSGGMYNVLSDPTLINVTFGGNTSGIYNENSNPTLVNCILWGNDGEIFNQSSQPHISYSNIAYSSGSGAGWDTELGFDGGGNLDLEPQFIEPQDAYDAPSITGNYRLRTNSPMIDAGNDLAVTVLTDPDGHARIVGDAVDLGAYEKTIFLSKAVMPTTDVAFYEIITYTVILTNADWLSTPSVFFSDTLPDEIDFAYWITNPGATVVDDVLTWSGTLLPNMTRVFSFGAIYTNGEGNTVANTAAVFSEGVLNDTATADFAVKHTCWVRLNDIPTYYPSVQAAVDASTSALDIVKVAGTCTGVQARAGITQALYIDKTVTVRGGYTLTNWTTPDPIANPTILDAQGQGRVLYIIGDITPVIEGLHITGGDATGLGGNANGYDAGGGGYVYTASATISNCVIYDNVASTSAAPVWSSGGGLYLHYSDAILRNNTIISNTASTGYRGSGGGLHLHRSPATLLTNTVQSNLGGLTELGYGGGLLLNYSAAVLQGNTVISNTASNWYGSGGGLYLQYSDAVIQNNTVAHNIASVTYRGSGGGLFLLVSGVTLKNNTISYNLASAGREASWGNGGGLFISWCNTLLQDNLVQGNIASSTSAGNGGGLYIEGSPAILQNNTIISNTATLSPTVVGQGGGLYVQGSSPFTFTNNLVTNNEARTEGSGLWFKGTAFNPSSGHLRHTTIAHNFGDGAGVYVEGNTELTFTNTIIAGHSSVGVNATTGSTATLEATLWHGNGMDTIGAGTISTGTINLYADPRFVDVSAGDYHLNSDSPAIDAGDARYCPPDDLDGNPRTDLRCDIGAFEVQHADSDTVVKTFGETTAHSFGPTWISVTLSMTDTGALTVTKRLACPGGTCEDGELPAMWHITSTLGAGLPLTVSFCYTPELSSVTDVASLRAFRWDTDTLMWTVPSSTSLTVADGCVTLTGIEEFSAWTLFDISKGAKPTATCVVALAARGGAPLVGLLTLGGAAAVRRRRRR